MNELTRERLEEFVKSFIPQHGDYIVLGKQLLAHDAALRARLEAVTKERDDLKERLASFYGINAEDV